MKIKKVHVRFERAIEVMVYCPEVTTENEIEDIANDLARNGLRGWDPDDWEAYVGRIQNVEINDDELKLGPPNSYGYRACLSQELSKDVSVVVNDEGDDFVCASDATWWVAKNKD